MLALLSNKYKNEDSNNEGGMPMGAVLFTGTVLIIIGAISAILGYKLFRLVLPVLGLFTGFLVGYSGTQAVLGTNTFTVTVGVIVALFVGLLFALLAYFFYSLGIAIIGGSLVAAMFASLATALGFSDDGIITLLLGISGFVFGFVFVTGFALQRDVAMIVSGLGGVALIMTGIFLMVGEVGLNQLHEMGIRQTFNEEVDTHFIWLMAWIGGGLVSYLVQLRTNTFDVFGDDFMIDETK